MSVNRDYKLTFGFFMAVLAFLLFASGQVFLEQGLPIAKAAPSDNVYGWAWAGDDLGVTPSGVTRGGVGWISFNCTNTGTCLTSNYGVKVADGSDGQPATGLFSGVAWAGNDSDGNSNTPEGFGWLSFNSTDLAGCQSTLCEARLLGNTVTGWAKFLNGNEITQGWDGFVSLDCSTTPDECKSSTYGVTYNDTTKEFSGYAWGGDVVGWISFNCNNPPSVCGQSSYKVSKGAPPIPQVVLSANPPVVADGGLTDITWSDGVGGNGSGFTSCTATGGPVNWNGAKTAPTPSQSQTQIGVGPLVIVSSPYNVSIECTGPYGTDSDTVPVSASPPIFTVSHDNDLAMAFPGSGGQSASTRVRVQPLYGFTGDVTLTASSPALAANGVSFSLTPSPKILSDGQHTAGYILTVTLNARPSGLPPDGTPVNFDIIIQGSGGGYGPAQDIIHLSARRSGTLFQNF